MTSDMLNEVVLLRQLQGELDEINGLMLQHDGFQFAICGRVSVGALIHALRYLGTRK